MFCPAVLFLAHVPQSALLELRITLPPDVRLLLPSDSREGMHPHNMQQPLKGDQFRALGLDFSKQIYEKGAGSAGQHGDKMAM